MEGQMKAIVTGAAGFIGSHLCERLLKDGYSVVGIDCFTDYYDINVKEKNISLSKNNKNFTLIRKNILEIELENILDGADIVFHEAAQPGVRASWGESFSIYTECNITATQKLLEALKNNKILPENRQVKKLVYASSSSVYGDAEKYPTKENFVPKPVSPYGVTKLAAEDLCYLYSKNFGIPAVSLRYFSVYGPRQRPDMGFNKFIKAILTDKEIPIYGNGEQTRDFTYVSDIIDANMAAKDIDCPFGEIFNIGGGATVSVNETISMLEKIHGNKVKVKHLDTQTGDVAKTAADITKAKITLKYSPKMDIFTGLTNEYKWLREKI
jgi:nucleoside-diphosphate-sugar epimerase